MGNLNIKGRKVETTFEYENDSMKASGSYKTQEGQEGIMEVYGTLTDKEGTYAGSFNARSENGKLRWSTSDTYDDTYEAATSTVHELSAAIQEEEK